MGPDSPLSLIDYIPDLLGEEHGFGCILTATDGRPVMAGSSVWLYTTVLAEGLWESWVRPFDLATLQAGPARRVLEPAEGRDSAVLHHVMAADDGLLVGILCNGAGIGAATAGAPDQPFVHDPGFAMLPQAGWETLGGDARGWTLENNAACVVIGETADTLDFWQGYDSYRAADFSGDLGWVHVRVDKAARQVRALERHPANPLPFRRADRSCARCGGNLASDVTVRGRRAYFYYTRPSMTEALLGLALCDDAMFLEGVEHHVIGTTLGEETVMEKFQAVRRDGDILLFHESRFGDGSWHTGLRRYRESKS